MLHRSPHPQVGLVLYSNAVASMFATQQNIFVINYEMLSTCAHEEKCTLSILVCDLHNGSNKLNLLWW